VSFLESLAKVGVLRIIQSRSFQQTGNKKLFEFTFILPDSDKKDQKRISIFTQ
jgi:hypothetical protein